MGASPAVPAEAPIGSEYQRLAVADLGVRPVQERVPLLVGGNGRRAPLSG